MLMAGKSVRFVSEHLHVNRNTISRLKKKFNETGDCKDNPKSGRPRKTTAEQDQFIQQSHLNDRFKPSTWLVRNIPGIRRISSKTIRRRLREIRLKARRPVIRPVLRPFHRERRLAWTRERELCGFIADGGTFSTRMRAGFTSRQVTEGDRSIVENTNGTSMHVFLKETE